MDQLHIHLVDDIICIPSRYRPGYWHEGQAEYEGRIYVRTAQNKSTTETMCLFCLPACFTFETTERVSM